jgi:CRISPR-associated protein Csd1
LAFVIGKDVEEITARLGPMFPRVLNTSDQGRFALGYFHQRGYRRKKALDENTESEETTESDL